MHATVEWVAIINVTSLKTDLHMPAQILIHIVPKFYPQADGAGEFALSLARALHKSYGIQSQFIACDPDRDGPTRVEGFIVQRLRARNEAGIWNLLSSAKEPVLGVLLHYCPYGYHKQGLPWWLYRGIKSWRSEQSVTSPGQERSLVTLFYNAMQSPVKPWNKEFGLRMPQRWLLQQFHRCSKLSVIKNHGLQFAAQGAALPMGPCWVLPESQPEWHGNSPDWPRIACRFYEAFRNELTDATTDARLGRPAEGEKAKPPVYVSGLKLAEPPVQRLQTPA